MFSPADFPLLAVLLAPTAPEAACNPSFRLIAVVLSTGEIWESIQAFTIHDPDFLHTLFLPFYCNVLSQSVSRSFLFRPLRPLRTKLPKPCLLLYNQNCSNSDFTPNIRSSHILCKTCLKGPLIFKTLYAPETIQNQ